MQGAMQDEVTNSMLLMFTLAGRRFEGARDSVSVSDGLGLRRRQLTSSEKGPWTKLKFELLRGIRAVML